MAAPDLHLADLLARAGVGVPRDAERAGAGDRNDVWQVDTSDGAEVVVRFLATGDRLAMETAAIVRAHGAGIPVAEVLWAEAAPRPVMVQARLPGVRLRDVGSASDALCSDAADVLRRIHALGVEGGFGNLGADLRGQCQSLGEWFVDAVGAEARAAGLLDAGPAAAPTDDDDVDLLRRSLDILERSRPLLDSQHPAFAHGDFHADNLLTDGERITGVLDWEAAKSGPPALDFGWWDWFSAVFGNPWPTDVLLDRYDPDRALDREELAVLRRLVVRRVWTRELIAGLRNDDKPRSAAARAALQA